MQVSIPVGFNTAPLFPKSALFSVYKSEKPGIENHARALLDCGVTAIYASGGTATYLQENGIPVINFNDDVTGLPPIMDGRVSTLGYPSAGAILCRRNDPVHMEELANYCSGLTPQGITLDIVAVSIYPFEQTLASGETNLLKLIEKIDIGGPTLLREAAKNCEWVVPVPGMKWMEGIIAKLRAGQGISFKTRVEMATETFDIISRYDAAIRDFFLSFAARLDQQE